MAQQKTLTRFLAPALVLLQGLVYGLGDPISKSAYDIMPVYSLLSIRYLLAFALLMLFAGKRVLSGLRQCAVRDWLPPSLCIAAAYVLGNAALGLTAATSVAFLRSLSTVMTPLLALALFGKRFGWKHIPIQLLVVVGLYLLCGLGGLASFGMGEVCSLLSALFIAGALVLGQNALDKMDALTLSTVQCGVSALLATICALLFNGGWHFSRLTPQIGGIIVYLAVACSVGGYLLQNIALERCPARTVSLLQCFCPVMTALFSRFILGERLSTAGLIGAGVILACVAAETLVRDSAPTPANTAIDEPVLPDFKQ